MMIQIERAHQYIYSEMVMLECGDPNTGAITLAMLHTFLHLHSIFWILLLNGELCHGEMKVIQSI